MKISGVQRGFTLIEVISVMVVVTIVGVVAGMGLIKIAEGFVLAKKNMATAQKGQIAMARIVKELNSVKSISSNTWTTISSGTESSITLTRKEGATTKTFTINQSGSNLLVDGDILVDNVNKLEMKYYNTYNGSSASTYSSTASVIGISLKLTGAGDVLSEFIDRVTL
ncbi:MAG: prepilin-type N-terminal cleavage/methylation domain-containing protein [Deltaproteobacteria bacterium]|nr:prepilin-type N-terminal cleavage/methylation domain-containing protein [Deltaproteobacteria bacterium]